MSIEIKNLNKKDYKTAIEFAKVGMHFDVYFEKGDKKLDLYSKYFWYSELLESTDCLAAYEDNKLVGVLLADMYYKPKIYKSFWKKIYVKLFEFARNRSSDYGSNLYVINNKIMLDGLKKIRKIDGEIKFLACDPNCIGKGIGSKLLNEFEERNKNKNVILFTDSECNYKFYDYKKYIKMDEKDIDFKVNGENSLLKCFIYYKEL